MEVIITFLKNIGPDWFVALFTGILVLFTGVLAFYTAKLWESTNKNINDNKKFYIDQLRAYVGVVNFNLNNNSRILHVSFELKNFGKTFAKNVNIIGNLTFLNETKKEIFFNKLIIFPNDIINFQLDINNKSNKPEGNLKIEILISYSDIYNNIQHIFLIYEYKNDKKWNLIKSYNKIVK